MHHQSNNPTHRDTLALLAERTSQGERELHFAEPHRWSRAAALIRTGFESNLEEGGAQAAADFAVEAYHLFSRVDLRGPCRTALGCLARLANEHEKREPFETIAQVELSHPIDFGSIADIGTKVHLVAIELHCRATAVHLLTGNTSTTRELALLTHTFLQQVDLSWQDCDTRDLWLIHHSALRLQETASQQLRTLGREGWELATSSRYLADLVGSLVDATHSMNADEESPLRILNISALGARDEYIDLHLPTRTEELLTDLRRGQATQFEQRALKIADHLGRVICRLGDIRDGAFALRRSLEMWRECWFMASRSTGPERDPILSAQFAPVAHVCAAMTLACESSTDIHAFTDIAQKLENVLRSEPTRRSKAPASSVAPIWMVAGRLWERVYEIEDDMDAGEKALTLYLEAARLLPLTAAGPTPPLVDCLDRIRRLKDVRDLEAAEQATVHLGHGVLAMRANDLSSALHHFLQAGAAFEDAITDPEVTGLKHMTMQTGRVYNDAAKIAERLGQKDASAMYLNKAAQALERVAPLFKIQASQQEVLTAAERYRQRAERVNGHPEGQSSDQGIDRNGPS